MPEEISPGGTFFFFDAVGSRLIFRVSASHTPIRVVIHSVRVLPRSGEGVYIALFGTLLLPQEKNLFFTQIAFPSPHMPLRPSKKKKQNTKYTWIRPIFKRIFTFFKNFYDVLFSQPQVERFLQLAQCLCEKL